MQTIQPSWIPRVDRGVGPVYLAIADAIAKDIEAGRLKSGDRLPAQRELALSLGVNFTTITRAYNEARRRGLIDAATGRGTYIRGLEPKLYVPQAVPARVPDLTMNVPPNPIAAALDERLAAGMAAIGRRLDLGALLTYQAGVGSHEDRAAAATLLEPLLGAIPIDRLMISAGTQAALLALMTVLGQDDALVVTEHVTYSRFRTLAAHLGLRTKGLAMDSEGLLPDALEDACRVERPGALYCVPTIHNPTTATMSEQRRRDIAGIARRYGFPIVEDDAYGLLPSASPPPIAAIAPDVTYYVAGLSKCIMPALRIAYLAVPAATAANRVAAAIQATTQMAPPLMAALATTWIGDGSARRIIAAIRAEAAARQRIASDALPDGAFDAHPEGHHLWLRIAPRWNRSEFEAYLRRLGLAVVPSDSFLIDGPPPEAVRIGLGAAPDRASLKIALANTAAAWNQPPEFLSSVI